MAIAKKIKYKKRYIVLAATLLAIAAVVLVFFQFTAFGYRMTVPLRNFSEVATNIYVHNDFKQDQATVVTLVEEAKQRVRQYFGDIKSNPTIIFCDDKNTIAKLGGDHDTQTFAFFRVYCYIVVSSEYFNIDVIAHELTHAEVHTRILDGKVASDLPIPVWFDEGVALQNDYRDIYNEDAWRVATDNGKNVMATSDFDTPAKFYAGDVNERRYRYILSKFAVSDWIGRNGVNGLIDLLDNIYRGMNFEDLYFTE